MDTKNNLNLTYGIRDGIISHCGEITENALKPRDEFIDLLERLGYQVPVLIHPTAYISRSALIEQEQLLNLKQLLMLIQK